MASVVVLCFASAGFVHLPGKASQPRSEPLISVDTKLSVSPEEQHTSTVGVSWAASVAAAAMLLGFVTGASPVLAQAKDAAQLADVKAKALESAVMNAQKIAKERESQVDQLDKAESLLKKLESNKTVEFSVKADNLKKQEAVREKIMEDLDKKAAKVEKAVPKPVETPKAAAPAKVETPKAVVATPKPAPAKVEAPTPAKVETPAPAKVETPKPAEPKVEAAKVEAPKVEAPKAVAPAASSQEDEDIPKAQAFFRQFFQKQKAKDAEIAKKQKQDFEQAEAVRNKVLEDLEKRRLEAKKAAEEAESIAARLEELAKNAREAAIQAKALANSP